MINGFKYFEGVPEEIVFDNMKTVVDHNQSNFKNVQINSKFKQFASDMNFGIFTCRPYRPQTKGKVEALAKLTYKLTAFNEEFDTYEDVVNIVTEFMNDINSEVSQGSEEIPFERHKEETEHLRSLPSKDLLNSYCAKPKAYKVSKESMIRYEGRKYSVPVRYIGKPVTVNITDNGHLEIYYTKEKIACHQITENKYHYQREHLNQILKSDVMKHRSDSDIDKFVKAKLSALDMLLEE